MAWEGRDVALSAEEENAFREWLASQQPADDDDTPDDDDDQLETDDDDQDDDDDDPGVTLKAGGVLIYRGKTYQRVKETPKRRSATRKRTGGTTGTPPRGKGNTGATRPKAPAQKKSSADPTPGASGGRKLFT